MDAPKTKCMNCGSEQLAKDCRLCFGVLVCAECHEKANIIYDRARAELRTLLTLLEETIRLALVEGRLTFATEQASASKAQILRTILGLMENGNGAKRSAAVYRPVGVGVPNQMPVPGMPGHRSRVADHLGGLVRRNDDSGRPNQSADRAVPEVPSASDDGGKGTGSAASK